jgi:hypothetical protein
MKAAMTSGTMSAAGDLLAQFLTGQQAKAGVSALRRRLLLTGGPVPASTHGLCCLLLPCCVLCAQSRGKSPAAYDPLRTLRMFGFGLCWYGPYQYYWYNLLDYFMPLKNTANFLAKVSWEGCVPAAGLFAPRAQAVSACLGHLQFHPQQVTAETGNQWGCQRQDGLAHLAPSCSRTASQQPANRGSSQGLRALRLL